MKKMCCDFESEFHKTRKTYIDKKTYVLVGQNRDQKKLISFFT